LATGTQTFKKSVQNICRPQAWTVDDATSYVGFKSALNEFVVHHYSDGIAFGTLYDQIKM
jgi:hypothetical protein